LSIKILRPKPVWRAFSFSNELFRFRKDSTNTSERLLLRNYLGFPRNILISVYSSVYPKLIKMNSNSQITMHLFVEQDAPTISGNPIFNQMRSEAVDTNTVYDEQDSDDDQDSDVEEKEEEVEEVFPIKTLKSKGRGAFGELLAKSLNQENQTPSEFTALEDMFPERIRLNVERYVENPLMDEEEELSIFQQQGTENPRKSTRLTQRFGSMLSFFTTTPSKADAENASNTNIDVKAPSGDEVLPTPIRATSIKRGSSKGKQQAGSSRDTTSVSESEEKEEKPHYSQQEPERRRRRRRSSLTLAVPAALANLFRTDSFSFKLNGNLTRAAGDKLQTPRPPRRTLSSPSLLKSRSSTRLTSSRSSKEFPTTDVRPRSKGRFTVSLFKNNA
jgi:hypothetical protein